MLYHTVVKKYLQMKLFSKLKKKSEKDFLLIKKFLHV